MKKIVLKNSQTSETKEVKVGWSWTLFLFAGFFGVPMFMRGLTRFGIGMIGLQLGPLVWGAQTNYIFGFAIIALSIFLAIKGNELTTETYMKRGWVLV